MSPAFQPSIGPVIIDVTTTATQYTFPGTFFTTPPGMNSTSYRIANPNPFFIRILGSWGSYIPVTDWNGANPGFLIYPNSLENFATIMPQFLSTLSVTQQGIAAGTGRVEIMYGNGE